MNTENLKWNDPRLWQGVKTGQCTKCKEIHVTRHGLCWNCENPQADATPKNPHAQAMGRAGGLARASALSDTQRKAIAAAGGHGKARKAALRKLAGRDSDKTNNP